MRHRQDNLTCLPISGGHGCEGGCPYSGEGCREARRRSADWHSVCIRGISGLSGRLSFAGIVVTLTGAATDAGQN